MLSGRKIKGAIPEDGADTAQPAIAYFRRLGPPGVPTSFKICRLVFKLHASKKDRSQNAAP